MKANPKPISTDALHGPIAAQVDPVPAPMDPGVLCGKYINGEISRDEVNAELARWCKGLTTDLPLTPAEIEEDKQISDRLYGSEATLPPKPELLRLFERSSEFYNRSQKAHVQAFMAAHPDIKLRPKSELSPATPAPSPAHPSARFVKVERGWEIEGRGPAPQPGDELFVRKKGGLGRVRVISTHVFDWIRTKPEGFDRNWPLPDWMCEIEGIGDY